MLSDPHLDKNKTYKQLAIKNARVYFNDSLGRRRSPISPQSATGRTTRC